MKILLLKPINDVYYTIQPSLGLGYIAAIMRQQGHEVRLLHAGQADLTWEGFAETLRREQPAMVGIQMLSHEFVNTRRHIEIIKKILPEAIVIVGGPHISGDPRGTMEAMAGLDFGFVSEAEKGVEEFLKLGAAGMTDPEKLGQIPNLAWRNGGEIVVNAAHKYMDLTEIPFPAWSLMPPASYPVAPHGNFCRQTPVAPLITSRGCPFPCTFCAGHRVTGRQVRFRTPEDVLNEIKLLYYDYGVREIHVEDEVFTLRKDYCSEICNRIIASGMKLTLALPNGVRLDSLDEDILRLLERTGFYSMGVGIESGSNRILKLMRKHVTTEKIREQVALIKRCTKIHLTGFFIMGYESETEAEVLATIAFAKSLRLDKANFMFLSPLPGSEVWDDYTRRQNREVNWANTFSYRITDGMSEIPMERMRQLHRKAVREFYGRPRILLGLLKQIRSVDQLKFIGKRLRSIFSS